MTINHIGISGGKDSTALLLWAIHESGYPIESLNVSFCDTGNENEITYRYVAMLSEKIFPIQVLKPDLPFFDLARKRFGTQFLKMKPTLDHVREIMAAGHKVLLHSGVRAAESEDRANLPIRGFDGYFGADVFRPLLTWGINDVWAIHKRYGIEPNPLYKMGMKRVGCFPCINSCKEEIRLIGKIFPERIERLADEEKTVCNKCGYSSFFARKTVPERFRSKQITTKDGEQMMVATAHDVALWSKTVHGGKQFALDFSTEDDLQEDDFQACPSSLGQCE
jgi:3'-phosphoadenosine 5'-phosphosulfate sulfotransferase (PAPS reductase)/FAD synthetase